MKHTLRLFLCLCWMIPVVTVAQVRKGQSAPTFQLPDAQGTPISLTSFLGSVVLVDFWASWCRPCRENNPDLVKLYAKYGGKGLKILGVSVDDGRPEWLRAVKADKLTWPQVIVPASEKSRILSMYGVSYIPATFLIDRKGVLQEADLRGSDLEAAVKKLLQ